MKILYKEKRKNTSEKMKIITIHAGTFFSGVVAGVLCLFKLLLEKVFASGRVVFAALVALVVVLGFDVLFIADFPLDGVLFFCFEEAVLD